jgi:hypothetical protein
MHRVKAAAARAGVPAAVSLQATVGHASLATTSRYAHGFEAVA